MCLQQLVGLRASAQAIKARSYAPCSPCAEYETVNFLLAARQETFSTPSQTPAVAMDLTIFIPLMQARTTLMKLFILALLGFVAAVNTLPHTAEWEDWKKVHAIRIHGGEQTEC